MLVLYTWGETDGRKPLMLLEELGLAYEIRPVDIEGRAQFEPSFLKLNPLGKVPVLEDPDIGVLTESNAILYHLATVTGRFLGIGASYLRVVEWLFWQASNCGPALTDYWFMKHSGQDMSLHAIDYFRSETERCLKALETTLSDRKYLSDEFSIADIAMLPHVRRELAEPEHADKWPAIRTWMERCVARPGILKGLTMEIRPS